MELTIVFILAVLFSFFYSKNKRKSCESSQNITKINDLNWIVDGKIVSFETDTPLLRMQQDSEDRRHYDYYEYQKLSKDSEELIKDFFRTKRAISENPSLKNCITAEKLEAITEKYEKYVLKFKKLHDRVVILTKEEFLIQQENVWACTELSIHFYDIIPTYTIYNNETAKYTGVHGFEKMEKEFKTKNY